MRPLVRACSTSTAQLLRGSSGDGPARAATPADPLGVAPRYSTMLMPVAVGELVTLTAASRASVCTLNQVSTWTGTNSAPTTGAGTASTRRRRSCQTNGRSSRWARFSASMRSVEHWARNRTATCRAQIRLVPGADLSVHPAPCLQYSGFCAATASAYRRCVWYATAQKRSRSSPTASVISRRRRSSAINF